MVCSLTCQYSILYGCNNTAHSSSGHALSLTLLLDTFIISSCLLAPPPSPLFLSYSAFLPLSLILSPHISSVCFLSQHLLFSSPSLPPSLPILSVPSISWLCCGPWAFYYLVVVQWPLVSTRRHSGISVISISVTCLSIFWTLEIKLSQTCDVLQITGGGRQVWKSSTD